MFISASGAQASHDSETFSPIHHIGITFAHATRLFPSFMMPSYVDDAILDVFAVMPTTHRRRRILIVTKITYQTTPQAKSAISLNRSPWSITFVPGAVNELVSSASLAMLAPCL